MRFSYANVVATLALFVALGGSGYAVTKITGKEIANRSITARNVKKKTLTGAEIARGAITRAKLARGVRSMLPAEDDDSGFDSGGGFPIDSGFPGEPGLPGEPGEQGPAGPAGCDADGPVLCPDEDLPSGRTARLRDGTEELAVSAYRTSCVTTPAAACTVIVSGPASARRAEAVYGNATPRTFVLIVESGSTVHRSFEIDTGRPFGLRNDTDRYQLTLSADRVRQTAP